jgi:hypothetical protein
MKSHVRDTVHMYLVNWGAMLTLSYIYVPSVLSQKDARHTLLSDRTINIHTHSKMSQMSSTVANSEALSVTERQRNHKNCHPALDPSTLTITATPSESHQCYLLPCKLKRAVVKFALDDAMPAEAPRNVIVSLSICAGPLLVPRSSQRPKPIKKYTVQYTRLPALALASRDFHAEVLRLIRHKSIVPLIPILTHPATRKSLRVPFSPSTSTLTLHLEKSSPLTRHIPAFYSALAPDMQTCVRYLHIECSAEKITSEDVDQLTIQVQKLYTPALEMIVVKSHVRRAYGTGSMDLFEGMVCRGRNGARIVGVDWVYEWMTVGAEREREMEVVRQDYAMWPSKR